jgi:hypothetical protein
MDGPVMAGFKAALEPMNALADAPVREAAALLSARHVARAGGVVRPVRPVAHTAVPYCSRCPALGTLNAAIGDQTSGVCPAFRCCARPFAPLPSLSEATAIAEVAVGLGWGGRGVAEPT